MNANEAKKIKENAVQFRYKYLQKRSKRLNGKLTCFTLIERNITVRYGTEIPVGLFRNSKYGLIRIFCDQIDNAFFFKFYDPIFKENKKVRLKEIPSDWMDLAIGGWFYFPQEEMEASSKIEEIIKEESELLTLINKHNKKQCQRPFKIMPKYVLVGNFPKHLMLYMPKQDKLMFRCEGKIVSQNICQYDMRRYFETYDISILFDAEREYYRSHRMREDISWCVS